jgi:hypothetical protein
MGEIAIAWHRSSQGAWVEVTVPPGTQAHLQLPLPATWLESGKSAAHVPGVLDSEETARSLRLLLGSGNYRFSTRHF